MYKVKKQKKILMDQNSIQDLNDIFNQLLGETKVLNVDIIYPKYNCLYELYEKSYKLLDMLRNHVIIKHMASEDETICNDLESYNEFMLSFKKNISGGEIYPSPNSYRIYLKDTMKSIRSVRLIASDFTNTNTIINLNNNKFNYS